MMTAELQSLPRRTRRRQRLAQPGGRSSKTGIQPRAHVASFGENLRKAREARKITLQEIAATTKIGTRALQALEDEQFNLLPGGIFNKGFVRAYARAVGLDEEKTVAAYLEAAKVTPSETDMEALAQQVAAARANKREPWSPNAATLVGMVAILVALGLGALWLREHRKEAQADAQSRAENLAANSNAAPIQKPIVVQGDPSPAPNAAANSTVTAPPGAAPDTTPSASQNATQSAPQPTVPGPMQSAASIAPQTKPATPAPGASPAAASAAKQDSAPVEISISAKARAWISVLSDDKPAVTITLDPEKPELSSRSFKARERLRLTVGNPAGVSVTYNGKPTGTLGAAGQRATIIFTPEGIQKQ
jgi:cytoskeleton protein RodZ